MYLEVRFKTRRDLKNHPVIFCLWSEVIWKLSSLSDSLQPHGLYSPWNSPGQKTGMGSCFLLQGIFPTQGSNPGLPHFRQILYPLNHKGSPRILAWVAHPFSSWSAQLRNWIGVSCIAGGFFTNWPIRKLRPIIVNRLLKGIKLGCEEMQNVKKLSAI